MTKTVDILRGPFDPGGQPEIVSPHKMLVGLFSWNVAGGSTISKAILADRERYRDYYQWPKAKYILQLADRIGFDFEVPFGRYLGHDGPIGFNDEQLDVVTNAAAASQVTQHLLVASTAHITYRYHPLHFAKFGAQIDQMSHGRWILNVVTGWFAEEYAMFSGSMDWIPHDERYEIADEFVTLMKWLWASDEPINYEGRYFKSKGGIVNPKPVRRPRPLLMNAGHSRAGIDFAANHCDWLFSYGGSSESLKETNDKLRERTAYYGRRVRPVTFTYNIFGDTDAQAKERFDWIANEMDEDATNRFIARATSQPEMSYGEEFGSQVSKDDALKFALGLGGWWMVGSPETQAELIRMLHDDCGMEGILLSCFDPLYGLHYLENGVFPILRKMGLRA